jgi:hypothetical protein
MDTRRRYGMSADIPGPRKCQRVVIYPKELSHLETVLSTGDPNADPEDGHPIAYQRVPAAASEFEIPPVFLKEDCEAITCDPVKSEAVPKWMCMAERIATGSRPRVLEDGPDTIHSDEDAEEDVEADKELGMYAPGVDPTLGPKVLSQAEVARQLAVIQASKAQASSRSTTTDSDFGNSIVSSRAPSPQSAEGLSEEHKRLKAHALECSLRNLPRPGSAPGTKLPPKKSQERDGNPGTRSRAVPDLTPQASESKKAAASPRAPADQPKGAQAPNPIMGQQVPKNPAEGHHPMATRSSDGSRAGGFRPGVGGSGQTDTCVASSHPSYT